MASQKVKEVDDEGNVFKGEMLNGQRHGQGILLYAESGDVYQGDFDNGLPHGSGKFIRKGKVEGNKDGIYEGLWDHGELTQVKKGKAKIQLENGDVYEGGFNHWKRHGKGKLVEYSGAIYEGQWKEGLRHGPGKQSYPDGYVFKGQFNRGKPVKDGTQREQHLEVDSIILNPYAEDGREESPRQSHNAARGKKKDQFSKLGRNKMKAQNEPNVYRANAKSTSGGMNRVQNSNTNRPRPTMQVEEPVFPEVHLPRTISFHTKSVANRDELEDNTIWQDGKSFGFVEEQQQPIQINGQRSGIFSSNGRNNAASTIGGDPLELKRRQLERLKEGKCLRKFAMSSITKLERQQSRQQSRHPSMQQSIQKSMQQSIQPSIYGGQSTAKKKGPFALLRSLSRGRARSKNQGRPQRPQNTQPQYDQDMFETGMDQEASEIPFTTNMPQFGFTHVEESAGRTPPDFDEEPMYTHAPAQRTSSRSRRRRDDGAEMNPHGHRPRSQSRPRQMRGPPSAHPLQSRRSRSVPRTRPMPPNDPMQYQSHRPRSVSRSKHDRSMSQNQMQGASSGRSRSRSRRAQPTDPRNGSESRGRERMSNDGSQWLRSTSKGRVHDQRNPNPTGRMQRVQGLQRNQSRHQNNAPMQNGPSSSRNRSRSRSRKHGQDMNDDNQYNPNMTYKQSIKSGRTQHTDAHMVRSISNKGKSATMGMLELSMSDDNDNYFVGY